MKLILFLGILVCGCMPLGATVYQWAVPIQSVISSETGEHPDAFLWIPAHCKQVKAVVMGQHNMCEETIFEHPAFRKAMAELDLAIIWISPGIDQRWDPASVSQQAFEEMMQALAVRSGYTELATAPVIPLGHSAMATFPWNFAAWNPDRTLAVISYHGDAPRTNLTGYGGDNIEWGRNRQIDGIPGLMIEGEYEWWEARVNPALAFRMMYPGSCISFLADAGHGHFDVSDEVVDYMILFIKKAVRYRLPAGGTPDQKQPLKKISVEEGWLAARWRPGSALRPEPAAFGSYQGDPHDAFWYFDAEMAAATERYYAREQGKKMQYIGMMQAGQWLAFHHKDHAQYRVTDLKTGPDGITFNLRAGFTDSARQLTSDQHAAGDIRLDRICGPVRKMNDSTFRLQFYRMGTNNRKRSHDIWLLASAKGDGIYKSTVQQINLQFPYPLRSGRQQRISFRAISNQRRAAGRVALQATSDSGLPVYYYVKAGPARVHQNELVFTEIPPRTAYPIEVTVVAWQYGQPGKFQTAIPITQSFLIYK